MGRIVTFVLGLGVLAFAAFWYLTNGHVREVQGDPPAETMQRMHQKAHDIEQEEQQRADEIMKRTQQAGQ